MLVNRLFLIAVIWLSVGLIYGFEAVSSDSLFLKIYFRQGYRFVQPDFRDNRSTLDELSKVLNEAEETGLLMEVGVRAYASPEGSDAGNERLARLRTDSLASWILRNTNVPEAKLIRSYGGVGWNILRDQLEDSELPYQQRVIDIIDNTPLKVYDSDGRIVGGRKQSLLQIDGGKLWNDMYRRFYPDIRCCLAVIVKLAEQQLTDTLSATTDSLCMPPLVSCLTVVEEVPVETYDGWMRRLHLKTNAVGWGLLMTNAAVEVDLCRHLSLSLPVYYSAWNYFSSTTKFRTFAVQPEMRYWFSATANDGCFVGAHLGLAYYNFATGGEFRTQDYNASTPAWGGGMSFGYRLPISANHRWRLELSAGVGVYSLHYDRFHNYANGLRVDTKKTAYFGIDQLAVTVSYSFDLKKGCTR